MSGRIYGSGSQRTGWHGVSHWTGRDIPTMTRGEKEGREEEKKGERENGWVKGAGESVLLCPEAS